MLGSIASLFARVCSRIAVADIDIPLVDRNGVVSATVRVAHLRTGDHVVLVSHRHHNPAVFHDPKTFFADRFVASLSIQSGFVLDA